MILDNAVWFITGCSKGLGRALAVEVLKAGDRVVATARRRQDLADLIKQYGDRLIGLELDVTNEAAIEVAVAAAHAKFGRIDVLVNNAGYGYLAAVEEGDDDGVRAMFETNVFGLWHMTKAVLPGMRERGSGYVVNISSIGGLVTFPAVGFYHMAKYAVEALSETLAKEVAPFGIGVTVVEPGAFRTDFRGTSSQQSPTRLAAYAETAGRARDAVMNGHGKQQGDPARGAQAIIAAIKAESPPLHLLLGEDALALARQKLADLKLDFDAWEHVTRDTKFIEA